jgi:hypothetical protein
MNWELVEFKLEEASGPVQVFNFEAVLQAQHPAGSASTAAPQYFRGDGFYMTRTRQLRLNRERDLAAWLDERVAQAQSGALVAQLRETVTQRIASRPLRRLRNVA